MNLKFIRTLRTTTSERFVLQSDTARDVAALDLHYLSDGSVVGTLIIVDDALHNEADSQAILQRIDQDLLPMASLNEKNLSFTVVHGKLIGQYQNDK